MGLRDDWKAYMQSIIATNGTKSITGATHQAVLNDLAESAAFRDENTQKANVRVATTTAGTLATSFENGDTIDGVALVTGDRILIKDQAAPADNGIYTVNASGAPTRATDFNSSTNVILGAQVYVTSGTVNAGKFYHLSAPTGTITVGTSSLTFSTRTLEYIMVALSDESTNLTTGTGKATIRMPFAGTLTAVRLNVNTAATGGTLLTVDINKNGTTVLSTKLTTDASEKTSVTAATQAVISVTTFADDDEFTFDIDAVGSTIAGKGAKVTMICARS